MASKRERERERPICVHSLVCFGDFKIASRASRLHLLARSDGRTDERTFELAEKRRVLYLFALSILSELELFRSLSI